MKCLPFEYAGGYQIVWTLRSSLLIFDPDALRRLPSNKSHICLCLFKPTTPYLQHTPPNPLVKAQRKTKTEKGDQMDKHGDGSSDHRLGSLLPRAKSLSPPPSPPPASLLAPSPLAPPRTYLRVPIHIHVPDRDCAGPESLTAGKGENNKPFLHSPCHGLAWHGMAWLTAVFISTPPRFLPTNFAFLRRGRGLLIYSLRLRSSFIIHCPSVPVPID